LSNKEPVIVGSIGAPHGVRGWVRINSFTDPIDRLFDYQLLLETNNKAWQPLVIEKVQPHGKIFIAKLLKIDDRDQAALITNAKLAVPREQLPDLDGEYYWADILGLTVYNHDNVVLGKAVDFFATGAGANDVLVVRNEDDDKEFLIPYVPEMYVLDVDLAQGQMRVCWDLES
jgi:16S rRNA processing protein RimM